VALPHLACAAYELPLTPDDADWWGDQLDEGVRDLVHDDRLVVRGGRAFWSGRGSPAWTVGLRSGTAEEYRVAEADGRIVGTVDPSRAFEVVHPGAVYLHAGTAWRVDELDLEDRVAWVSPGPADELTSVRSDVGVRILGHEQAAEVGRVSLHLGAVEVRSQVIGYKRRHLHTGEDLGTFDLDLPPSRLVTRAFWYVLEPDVLLAAGVEPAQWPGTLHAVEHAAIGILPLFTICDRWDVGGVSTALQGETGRPTIVVHDAYPGGAGIAELGFAAGRRLLEATLEVVASCPCATGCPSCVQSPKCGNWNEPLDKAGAVAVLRSVLGRPAGAGACAGDLDQDEDAPTALVLAGH
jgi:DEAD/DEAH box helicase domain-containing protein